MDNDPQSSLTQGFFGPEATHAMDPDFTVAGFYAGTGWLVSAVQALDEGFSLVPGSPQAKQYNDQNPASCPWEQQTALVSLAAEAREQYDYTLIDCPPNLHLCSWAALAAADGMVVPLKPEDYGAQGVSDVQDSFDAVRSALNPSLEIYGYLLTLVQARRGIHQAYEEGMRAAYGDLVFATKVPDLTDFVEALNRRQTVQKFKPKSPAAKTMRALADEFEMRAVRPREGVAG